MMNILNTRRHMDPILIETDDKIIITDKTVWDQSVGFLYVGPRLMTYGKFRQDMMRGRYGGVQCTSMATAALVLFAKINGEKLIFSPDDIDSILLEGHVLHTYFRETLKLSKDPDRMISIENIPCTPDIQVPMFGKMASIQLAESASYVFVRDPIVENMITIKKYIEEHWRLGSLCGFLLTVKVYSYAVMVLQDGRVQLFDSHGHLRFKGEVIVNRAGVLALENLQQLEEYICSMYSASSLALIGKLSVTFPPVPTTILVGECDSLPMERADVTCETLGVLNNSAVVMEPPTEPTGSAEIEPTGSAEVAPPTADVQEASKVPCPPQGEAGAPKNPTVRRKPWWRRCCVWFACAPKGRKNKS